ncbi:MAG: DUF1993 domain-containing protein [Silanimonas sp.]
MHALTVPALVRALTQLKHVLAKGEAHARSQGWDPAVLLAMRLAPDMFPLTRQVQIATDIAKNSVGRMTGGEAPKFEDTETSFEQLAERIDRTVAYLQSVPAAAFDGAETRAITVPTRARGDLHFQGHDYLFGFILPNVHFHCTTAYALLRHAGVPIGKADYLGPVGTGQA